MRYLPVDVSHYKAVHHIGDIQGCYDPLVEYFNTYPMRDDELYIFVGDYCDRGRQNAETLQWVIDNRHRENIIFLAGNHERHLRKWVRGIPGNLQFDFGTRPQLERAGISKAEVAAFLDQLKSHFFYTHGHKTVLVCHGGLDVTPDMRKEKIDFREFIKGTGPYAHTHHTDAAFHENTPEHTHQIHGHRNMQQQPTRINESCFNLEGRVEFGGELRTVTLQENEFFIRNIKSHSDSTRHLIVPNHGANYSNFKRIIIRAIFGGTHGSGLRHGLLRFISRQKGRRHLKRRQ